MRLSEHTAVETAARKAGSPPGIMRVPRGETGSPPGLRTRREDRSSPGQAPSCDTVWGLSVRETKTVSPQPDVSGCPPTRRPSRVAGRVPKQRTGLPRMASVLRTRTQSAGEVTLPLVREPTGGYELPLA